MATTSRATYRMSALESDPSDSTPSTEGIPGDLDHELMATGIETETDEEEGGWDLPREQRLADEPGVEMERAVRQVKGQRRKGGAGFYGEPEPFVRNILTRASHLD